MTSLLCVASFSSMWRSLSGPCPCARRPLCPCAPQCASGSRGIQTGSTRGSARSGWPRQGLTLVRGCVIALEVISNACFYVSVGINCRSDPFKDLEALKLMKAGLAEADLLSSKYLMVRQLIHSLNLLVLDLILPCRSNLSATTRPRTLSSGSCPTTRSPWSPGPSTGSTCTSSQGRPMNWGQGEGAKYFMVGYSLKKTQTYKH